MFCYEVAEIFLMSKEGILCGFVKSELPFFETAIFKIQQWLSS